MSRLFRLSLFPLLSLTLITACTSGSLPLREDGTNENGEERAPTGGAYEGLPDAIGEQRPEWTECGTPTALQGTISGPPPDLPDGTAWECADLIVPRDYDDPGGETIAIALVRGASAAGDARLGSLVFNFGGPGGSGVATLPSAAEDLEQLREGGYDLVSFDPRGVGESEGVVCFDDATRDAAAAVDGSPDTPAEEAAYLETNEDYVAACEANSGPLLPHLTTAATARDMDVLRHVLGDDRLHYFGVSYGTELGAVYAHLFPERVGRTVLDSVVDPDPDPVARALLDAEGFQLALDHYLADCAERASCPTGSDVATGNATLVGLLEEVEEEPLPTSDPAGRVLTAGTATTAIASALYSEEIWEYLTLGLREALFSGTGDTLLLLTDLYYGRDPATGGYSNLAPANVAINCADDPSEMSLEEVREHQDEFVAASPVFGSYMVWGLSGCTGWPFQESSEPPVYSAPDAAEPLLLVATTGDPATPYAGAVHMQEVIGGPGVAPLLTYEGEGHGAYSSGDACVTEAVNNHLLRGEVPPDGTTCS
jgi:pimeloyl-ACP methyl ester carboxylesterase